MNRTFLAIPALAIPLMLFATPAAAQVPFFGAGVGIFDPEIGVVQSGVLNDAQAVVSADRKYVTLTMRLSNAQLLSLQEFAFQRGNAGAGMGFVGGAGAAAGAGGRRGNGAAAAAPARPSVLDRPGMTLLARTQTSPPEPTT